MISITTKGYSKNKPSWMCYKILSSCLDLFRTCTMLTSILWRTPCPNLEPTRLRKTRYFVLMFYHLESLTSAENSRWTKVNLVDRKCSPMHLGSSVALHVNFVIIIIIIIIIIINDKLEVERTVLDLLFYRTTSIKRSDIEACHKAIVVIILSAFIIIICLTSLHDFYLLLQYVISWVPPGHLI